MQFKVYSEQPATAATPCLILPLLEDEALVETAAAVNEMGDGQLQSLIDSGDLSAKKKKCSWLPAPKGINADRILVVGFGKREKLTPNGYTDVCQAAGKILRDSVVTEAVSALHELSPENKDSAWAMRHSAIGLHHGNYKYTATKKPDETDNKPLQVLHLPGADEDDLQQTQIIADAYSRVRILGDLPPNLAHPQYLADLAQSFTDDYDKVHLTLLNREKMESLGMGALLAVAAGSSREPYLILLEYHGAGDDQAPVALVGKGITFDTGGISLKPRENMDQMKYDMGGAASVLGAFEACAKLQLPINLVTAVAAVENMPDGNAYRPGDVVTSLSGKTIEVMNTDAEGRMVLADALAHTEKTFKPDTIIDAATLTGACVVALGHHASAVMSQDDELANALIDAGEAVADRAWRLPLWDDYQSQIETPYADMQNVGGMPAGSITAGCFLSRFVEDTPWAHLDIAGSAWKWGTKASSTGRPVGLLIEYLQRRASQA